MTSSSNLLRHKATDEQRHRATDAILNCCEKKKSLCKATCEIFYNVKKFNVFNTNRVLPYELDRKLRHSRKKWQQKLQGKSVNKYQLLN